MPTDEVIFEANSFTVTARELLSIAAQNVYNSYPPYNLDIYNTYIRQTTLPKTLFTARPVPVPLLPEDKVNFLYPTVEKTEPDMLSFNNNNCDIFATDFDYDLDFSSIKEEDIIFNNLDIASAITQYSTSISGIWRPYFLYIDPKDKSLKNSYMTRSASAQENPYETGLGIENFITVQNPIFKNWQLSEGSLFKVDWKIEKDNFLTSQFLGVLFWYRYYDRDRETNIKQTFTIKEYQQDVNSTDYGIFTYGGKDYKEQKGDHVYTEKTSINIERFGLHSGLSDGDKVLIKDESSGKEFIYSANKSYWTCLGEKRFISGLDIYIPEDKFYAYFNSTFDMEDWNKRDAEPTRVSNFSYPRTKLVTNDLDRYSNMLNKLLNFESNKTLQNIFAQTPTTGSTDTDTDTDDGDEEEGSGSLISGIYLDGQYQSQYINVKNLARFLCTAPIGADMFVDANIIQLDKIDLSKATNIITLKTNLENIFGNNFPAFTPPSATKPLEGAVIGNASTNVGPMPITYIANILSQNELTKSFGDNIIQTKKDLLLALLKSSQKNRYIEFPKNKRSRLISKFTVDEPHLRMVLDFQDKKTLGTNSDNATGIWYKQRVNVCGLEFFTRLKLPDDNALKPGEKEAIVLSYVDIDDTTGNNLEIPIMSSLDTVDTSKEYYNQVIKSVYEKFGIAQLFRQKYNLEKNLLVQDGSADYYDILFKNNNSPSFKLLKNTSYQENQTFDNSIRFYNNTLNSYSRDNQPFQRALGLVEQRFSEMSVRNKGSVFPNIKEFYMHRLGGFYFTDISLITIGKSKFWSTRTGPVGIRDAQYFLPQSSVIKSRTRPQDKKKITIEFECGASTTVELYSVKIEKLRDNLLENGNCRQFPNKTPLFGDETRVYDTIIGYEFNESSNLLTTRAAPPIVSYGGHRAEHIAEFGLSILGHPKPIETTEPNSEYPIYRITQDNVLPETAKNSFYYIRDAQQLAARAQELGVSSLKDRSLVKCFLTPTNFSNQVTFRKGFFHPNKGWLDYTLLQIPNINAGYLNKTAVKDINDSPCKTYKGQGIAFNELQLTKAEDVATAGSTVIGNKDYSLLIRDPMETYTDPKRATPGLPNILTVELDRDVGFITYLAATMKNFTHPVPKELNVGLFDALEQRRISYNIIAAYLNRLLTGPGAGEDPNFGKKIQLQLIKEKNFWLGSWQNKEKTSPRSILFHSTMLNYSSNFNAIFSNFSKQPSTYAFSNDFILPAQSLDYYIGSSGVYGGFWTYDGVEPASIDNGDGIPIPDPDAPAYVGEDSGDIGRKWGLQISDMGAEDDGGSCFDLQVCTGCPVPGYTQSYIYNRFAYNNETFNIPYSSGYNFIANFRNKLHFLPPINIEAPHNAIHPEYPKTNVGTNYAIQLGCLPEPDAPRPRETILPESLPEPIFIPPFHPSLVGLLTYIAIANDLQSQGYGWDLGFLTGAFFPSPLYFGASRREKIQRYMENKGYLQIEGTTAGALKLGFGGGSQDISLYNDAPFGKADKIQIEVKHSNGLWYNVEADIFRYSSYSSPVLENTKFTYLKDSKYINKKLPSGEHNYIEPIKYPGFDYNFDLIDSNNTTTTISLDGVRAFYSFMKDEMIELMYKIQDHSGTPSASCHPCITQYEGSNITNYKQSVKIKDIYIKKIKNPRYVKSDLKIQDPETTDISFIDPPFISPDSFTDEDTNPKEIYTSQVIIELETSIDLNKKTFITGCIYKNSQSKSRSFLLFDPLLTSAGLATSGNINYRKNDETPAFLSNVDNLGFTFGNNSENIKFGKWSNVRDRSLGTFTSSYIYDQMFAEGGLGWGTNLIKPESIPVIGNQEKYPTLLDLDYHFSKTNFCGKIKFIKNFDNARTHIANIKFNPRQNYPNMPKHPYTASREDEFISFTGYPRPLNIIPDRIYAHNIFSISETNRRALDIDSKEQFQKYSFNKNISEFYLPFYDLTLSSTLLDSDLSSNTEVLSTELGASAGYVQIENIFNNKTNVVYDNNYYWISIPSDVSGVLSSSSKIPVAVIQKCFHSKGSYSFCNNICNTQMVGPKWPNMNDEKGTSMELIYKLPDEETTRAPGITYEERQSQQTFYMGCGEARNDSNVRVEVTQVYQVPAGTHTYVSARDLFENANDLDVKFKYLPRKIPTDFQLTLGTNIVNQSQLYTWECHKTNLYNIYNKKTLTTTPPFYQVLNEMIFRAWFGERQKISMMDTYDQKIYLQQNHYKWVPYDYDDSNLFTNERDM
jgi:hypothetical protein